jgi:NADPH-dependent curcumin reductase CurA
MSDREEEAMKRLLVGVLVTAALGGVGFVPTAVAKSCSSGFTPGVIGGQQKCLHAGEYCSHAEATQYRRYHFSCVRVRGVYRLEHS